MTNTLDKLEALKVGWQDIAEAPKDGTYFIIRGGRVNPTGYEEDWMDCKGHTLACFYREEWRDEQDIDTVVFRPTHFAPLDSPDTAKRLHEVAMEAVRCIEIMRSHSTEWLDPDAVDRNMDKALNNINELLERKDDK